MSAPWPANRSMPDSPVIPVLSYPDVREASAWLCRAFGFTERLRIAGHRIQLIGPQGRGDVVVTGGSEPSAPGMSVMIRVTDVDAHLGVAIAAGATLVRAAETYPCGERQYTAQDPAGYIWTFSQTVHDSDPASWGGELVG